MNDNDDVLTALAKELAEEVLATVDIIMIDSLCMIDTHVGVCSVKTEPGPYSIEFTRFDVTEDDLVMIGYRAKYARKDGFWAGVIAARPSCGTKGMLLILSGNGGSVLYGYTIEDAAEIEGDQLDEDWIRAWLRLDKPAEVESE